MNNLEQLLTAGWELRMKKNSSTFQIKCRKNSVSIYGQGDDLKEAIHACIAKVLTFTREVE